MAQRRETWLVRQMCQIALRARKEIVDADHMMTLGHQAVAEMRARKPAPPVTRIFLLIPSGAPSSRNRISE